MKSLPKRVIVIESAALLVLWACIAVLIGFGVGRRQPSATPAPSEIAAQFELLPSVTSTATADRTPEVPFTSTHEPTVTGSPTSTPDPIVRLTSCGSIEIPGQYVLAADISTESDDCIRIRTSQVHLDCDNHVVRGSSFSGRGIAILTYGWLNDQIPSAVEISNCRISHFRYGIYTQAGRDLAIHDNWSSENFDDADRGSRYGKFSGMTDGGGIRVESASNSAIWGNTTLTQAIGIDIRNSQRVVVRDNVSSNNSARGINIVRSRDSQFLGNTTNDNVRQCTWGAGVIGLGCDAGGIMLQDGSSRNVISGNRVFGKNGNGIFIKSHALPCGNDNSVIGNTVEGALYNSIELAFCSGNKINNNVFREGLDAIWLGYSRNTEIMGNTIENMKNHGVIVSNSHDVLVSENRIVNSNVGIYVFSEKVDWTVFYWLSEDGDYWSHDNCLCRNSFLGNYVSIHLNDTTNNHVTNNDLRGNARGIQLQGNTRGNDMEGNLTSAISVEGIYRVWANENAMHVGLGN